MATDLKRTRFSASAPITVARAAAALAVVVGLLGFVVLRLQIPGWGIQLAGLRQFTLTSASGLVLLGVALICRLAPTEPRVSSLLRQFAGQLAAALALTVGVMSLGDCLSGGQTNVAEEFLSKVVGSRGLVRPGESAFPTALCMASLGLGLVALDLRLRGVWPSQMLAVTSLLIAFLAVIGYLSNVPEFYGELRSQVRTRISPAAAIGFLALGAGLLCARPERGLMVVLWSDTPGGVLVRWLMMAPAIGLLLTGIVYVTLSRIPGVARDVRTWALGLSNLFFVTAPIWAAAHALHKAGVERDRAHRLLEERVQQRTAELTHLNAALHAEIDERRQAEQAVREAHDRLEKQAAELEQRVAERTAKLRESIGELEAFSYSVAHDMRAPLRGMQGFARLLLDEHARDLNEEAHNYLERIASSATRMDMLIQDVLQYTRVIRTESLLAPVDLDRFVRHLVSSYIEWQPPKAEIQIEGTLPVALAHEGFLTQCVSNLVGNAVKFVAPGIVPRVRLWAEERAETVLLFVEDNGIGIAEKDHERVFRMFERLNPLQQYEGTGIGLTIVRKAADRMGGSVGFDSTLGRGSKFWIQLQKPKPAGAA